MIVETKWLGSYPITPTFNPDNSKQSFFLITFFYIVSVVGLDYIVSDSEPEITVALTLTIHFIIYGNNQGILRISTPR